MEYRRGRRGEFSVQAGALALAHAEGFSFGARPPRLPGTVCRWFEEALEPTGSSDDEWSLSIKAKPKPTFLSDPSSG